MALQYLLAPTFQFVNTAGKPLSGGAYMEVYVHGTRKKYFCASDFDGTLHPFRIPLDSLGSNIVLANDTGSYDVYAYNRYGTLMMSRYNVKPGAGGGIGGTITSTDGSIDIHPTEDGVDLSVNGLEPSCLKVSANPRTTDGKFHFDTLVKEGDQAYVDNEGAIRLIKGWYHFTANVQLAWNAGARNETHQVTLYTTLSNSVIDFDISHVHTETIELSGDVSIAEDGSELVIGVRGLPTGLEASVVSMDVHAITGKDGHDKYYAGNGITISNENYIAADFDEVQEKLVAGQGVTIEGNVISAPSLVQVNSDWNATSGVAEILNKPDLDVFATKTEVNAGLAGKQDTIPDLAAIRSGATAGASAVQPSDLAAVATTGDYNSLNNRPNLTVYATKTEVNTGLATKQDVISDLAAIRSGATAGASAVQPSDLAAVATTGNYNDLNNRPNLTVYATKTEVNTGLATKQDVISDLSAIRAGAQAGATAVQPAALDSYATKVELNTGLSGKQDTINDLSEIRSGAAAGATALQHSDVATVATTGDYADLTNKPSIPAKTSDLTNDSGFITLSDVPAQVKADWNESDSSNPSYIDNKPDLSVYATTSAMNTALATKQDTLTAGTGIYIDENNVISSSGSGSCNTFNAVYGVTTISEIVDAVNAGCAVFVSGIPDEPGKTLPLVVFRPNLESATFYVYSGTAMYMVGLSSGKWEYYAYSAQADWNETRSSFPSYIYNKPDLSVYATTQDMNTALDGKQDTISDLATIRSGAAEGATAVQPGDLATVATTGSYDDLVNKPTIPAAQVNSDWNSDSGVSQILNKPTLATVATTGDYYDLSNKPSIPAAQVNSDWNAVSGVSEILNKPTIPSGTQLVPAATSADADKVLTVNAQGTPAWATAQAPISAGDGVEITNNVVSAKVDGTTVTFNASGELQAAAAVTVDQTYNAASTNAQSGTAVAQAVATKEDAFDVGTGLEMDTSGATPTLQVEAPVDIVAGPGIVIDNPDGNTLRVSQAQDIETVLWSNDEGTDTRFITWSQQSLSEDISHFGRVKFLYNGDNAGNGEWHEFDVVSGGYYTLQSVSVLGSGGIAIRVAKFSLSGTSITNDNNVTTNRQPGGTWDANNTTGYNVLYRIVGLNRISGGN